MLKPGCFDLKFDPTGSCSIYNAIQRFLHIIDRIWKARRKDILILQIHKPIAVNFFKVLSNTNMVKILIFHGSYKISHRNLIWFWSSFLIARFHINLRNNYSNKRNIIIPRRAADADEFRHLPGTAVSKSDSYIKFPNQKSMQISMKIHVFGFHVLMNVRRGNA